jgi:hypothetical protein
MSSLVTPAFLLNLLSFPQNYSHKHHFHLLIESDNSYQFICCNCRYHLVAQIIEAPSDKRIHQHQWLLENNFKFRCNICSYRAQFNFIKPLVYEQIMELRKNEDSLANTAIETMILLILNCLKNPNDEKYRKINLNNKKIQQRIVQIPGGIDTLSAIGFTESDGHLALPSLDTFVLTSSGNQISIADVLQRAKLELEFEISEKKKSESNEELEMIKSSEDTDKKLKWLVGILDAEVIF